MSRRDDAIVALARSAHFDEKYSGISCARISEADKVFVAKVSQGGMYEVELGKLGETKAVAQDIKDQANTEAHDHMLVGDKLKYIVEANGMEFPKQLNAEFQAGPKKSTPCQPRSSMPHTSRT
jgi:predicted outer membrane protein